MKKYNIIYMHSHDTGRHIKPYGHAVDTPSLQKLAEQGVLFRNAFCAGPTCSPSRAALVTGQSPHSSGMLGLAHRGFELNDYKKHMIHTLKAHGYNTALSGVQHVAHDANLIGYDRILTSDIHREAAVKACDFLSDKPQEPFFLAVGFQDTHLKWPDAAPSDDERYTLVPSHLPDTPQTRRDMARFKTSVRRLDTYMGMVLGALNASGLADNTLVICTTDHGLPLPHMKCNLTDSGTGVFLILKSPGGFTGGQVVDAMVSHIDIFPTLCDLLEIDKPEWLEGNSFLPVVEDPSYQPNEAIFTEINYHASYEPTRAVRTDRFKYIRHFDSRQKAVLPNCDDSLTKALRIEQGVYTPPVPHEQLYDLLLDPNEVHNLIDDMSHQHVVEDMRARLKNWMQRTNDPLLNGTILPPEGAIVCSPDGISTKDSPLGFIPKGPEWNFQI